MPLKCLSWSESSSWVWGSLQLLQTGKPLSPVCSVAAEQPSVLELVPVPQTSHIS